MVTNLFSPLRNTITTRISDILFAPVGSPTSLQDRSSSESVHGLFRNATSRLRTIQEPFHHAHCLRASCRWTLHSTPSHRASREYRSDTAASTFQLIHVIMTSAVSSSLGLTLHRFSPLRRKSPAAKKQVVVVRASHPKSSSTDGDHASRRQIIGTGLAATLAVSNRGVTQSLFPSNLRVVLVA
jgi:hypothetical protein